MDRYHTLFTGLFLSSILAAGTVKAYSLDHSGLAALFGEPVTTSATGKPQRISETPVSMDIISSEEIRRSGAMDIPQLLRRYAGIDVSRNNKGHVDVNIHGYNQPFSNRLLVLINGRQVYLDNYGLTLWHSLPIQLSEIQQIEIIRGPNTSLFGFNAASGVINIITTNPLNQNINTAEARIGTQQYHAGSAVTTLKPNDDLAVRISAGRMNSDDFSYRTISPTYSADNTIEKKNANLHAYWEVSDHSSLNVETGISSQETNTLFPYHLSLTSDTVTRYLMADYGYDAGNHGLWQLRAFRNELDFRNDITQDNRLNVLQLSLLFPLSNHHTLRVGTEYRNNALKGPTVGTGEGTFSMDILSANAMWNWQINDSWSLTNAIRADSWETEREGGIAVNDTFTPITLADYAQSNVEYSFNSGLLYRPASGSTYRLSLARGLHIPSLDELALDIGNVTGGEFYGIPFLNTESTTLLELGYNRKLSKHHVTLGGNLFYEQVHNVISPTLRSLALLGGNGGAEADFSFENVGNSKSYGIEFTAKGLLLENQLNWHANYTYIHTKDDPDGMADHFIDFATTQPKHKVNLALAYTHGPWEVDGDIHYVSGVDYRATVADLVTPRTQKEIDAYVLLNSRIGYHLNAQTTISLDGYNLLDEHQERPAYTFAIGPNNETAGGSTKLRRALFLTVRHRF